MGIKRLRVFGGILVAAFLVVASGLPTGAQEANEIRIGVIGPMKYSQGHGHWNGALMAADEINARGGLQVGDKKMKIRLVKADSNEFLSRTDAINAMERLLTVHQVDFVVGGFHDAVLDMQEIAMDQKTIFIGCGAADNKLCERVAEDYDRYKYWFRETPFNVTYLLRATFILVDHAAGILKSELNIPKLKVAVVAEKARWADPLVGLAKAVVAGKGMEVVGVWRPSPVATNLSAELAAIKRSGAHIIFTSFSTAVGIYFAKQAGELQIPAVQVGINVEAEKDGFWEATKGMGEYVMILSTYCRGVEANENTKAFVEGYYKRFSETPTYTADTYSAIVYTLAPAIEQTGSLDPDKIIAFLENYEHKNAVSTIKYMKDAQGRPLHDLTWGPGYATGIGIQWQDGKIQGVWPYKWKLTPDSPEITYKGIVPYKIPPWMIEKYKK